MRALRVRPVRNYYLPLLLPTYPTIYLLMLRTGFPMLPVALNCFPIAFRSLFDRNPSETLSPVEDLESRQKQHNQFNNQVGLHMEHELELEQYEHKKSYEISRNLKKPLQLLLWFLASPGELLARIPPGCPTGPPRGPAADPVDTERSWTTVTANKGSTASPRTTPLPTVLHASHASPHCIIHQGEGQGKKKPPLYDFLSTFSYLLWMY